LFSLVTGYLLFPLKVRGFPLPLSFIQKPKQFALEPAFHLHTMPTEAPQLDFTSFQGATEGKNRIQHFFI
jgi:hypothetical protein